jgi:predicted Na+-dependent transporter
MFGATPTLYVSSLMPVQPVFCSTVYLQVVLVPVALGAYLNQTLPGVMWRLTPFAPIMAATMTVLVSSSIVAQNAAAVQAAGLRLIAAVVALHLGAARSLDYHTVTFGMHARRDSLGAHVVIEEVGNQTYHNSWSLPK